MHHFTHESLFQVQISATDGGGRAPRVGTATLVVRIRRNLHAPQFRQQHRDMTSSPLITCPSHWPCSKPRTRTRSRGYTSTIICPSLLSMQSATRLQCLQTVSSCFYFKTTSNIYSPKPPIVSHPFTRANPQILLHIFPL